MRLRTSLTLSFAAMLAAVLVLFASVVYVACADYRREEYYRRLRQQALTKARLLLDARIAPATLRLIYQNTRAGRTPKEVAIYDDHFRLLYDDDPARDFVQETPQLLRRIARQGELHFEQQDRQVVGIRYVYQGRTYLLTAAASDRHGLSKLHNLGLALGLTLLGSLALVLLAGHLLARLALRPITRMVHQVRDVTASSLDKRIRTPHAHDELGQLGAAFNAMLDRLKQSLEAQREFVSNVAHELRTPLAAVVGELELTSQRRRQPAEYEQALARALADTHHLNRLLNHLLDLAKASADAASIHFGPLRLDELLLAASQQVTRRHPAYRVQLVFADEAADEADLTLHGNDYLLTIALANLLDNGCKYSADHRVTATVAAHPAHCSLRVADHGIGIAAADLPHVFTAFYRGENRRYAAGSGIGLALTQRIVALHGGQVQVASAPGVGTTVTLDLPTRRAAR